MSTPSGDQRRGLGAAFTQAGELPDLAKAEQIRHDGFPAAVLIGAVWMQAIAATSGFQIDQGNRQVVAAKEPRENTRGFGFPFDIMVGAPCRETGGDGGRGLERLLIERLRRLAPLAKSCGADGAELAVRRCLLLHQPTQRFQAAIQITALLVAMPVMIRACGQTGVIVGKSFLEPDPVVVSTASNIATNRSAKRSRRRARSHRRNRGAIAVEPQQDEGPGTRRVKGLHRRHSLGEKRRSPCPPRQVRIGQRACAERPQRPAVAVFRPPILKPAAVKAHEIAKSLRVGIPSVLDKRGKPRRQHLRQSMFAGDVERARQQQRAGIIVDAIAMGAIRHAVNGMLEQSGIVAHRQEMIDAAFPAARGCRAAACWCPSARSS